MLQHQLEWMFMGAQCGLKSMAAAEVSSSIVSIRFRVSGPVLSIVCLPIRPKRGCSVGSSLPVALVRSTPRASMLLSEAMHAANARAATAPVMRPACAMLPQVLSSGLASTSSGCIGNRVYTGLPDDEMWHTLPGARLDAIVEKLSVVDEANRALAAFHEGRVAAAQTRVP